MPVTHSEFFLIDNYFKSKSINRSDVFLGIGDDAAVTTVPTGMQLVSAVDTMVSGVHFSGDTPPYCVGYKSLAVNLSDLAAMGAEPAWATLAITMPQADEAWIQHFCDGFFNLAKSHSVQLIGGDTTQGPLTITVQIMGLVPDGQALTRRGAQVGDLIYVSGTLGDAAAALTLGRNDQQVGASTIDKALRNRLDRPTPRVELGLQLRKIASSAIDISDGLASDLSHVLEAGGVGATIRQESIPLSSSLDAIEDTEQVMRWALQGGDDYELCFTVLPENSRSVETIARQLKLNVTEIGFVEEKKGLRLSNEAVIQELSPIGFEHFSKP